MVALCSLTALFSALLLFSVQPMVAKMLLPTLGGSPSVWNTAMVFYQGALLLGYLYAHGLARRLPVRAQTLIHGILLFLPFLVLPLSYGALHPPASGNPTPWMLLTMATSVGLPFFVLSATSPLIQSWFARAGGGDPYFLYAASNVGSFLGLLAYPLVVEPRTGVAEQSVGWTWGYAAVVLLFMATIALVIRKNGAGGSGGDPVPELEPEPIDWKRRGRWVFLAFLPSSLFIGVTSYLTTDIAVMPLLWVIPLAIYLLTMVLVFAKRPPIPHKLVVAVFPFFLAGLVFLVATEIGQFKLLAFGAHLLVLFFGAMLCHGELAKDRPSAGSLTEFFLWMSLGGVLGGVFNALVAPAVFVQVIEYAIVLGAIGFAMPLRSDKSDASTRVLDFALPLSFACVLLAIQWLHDLGSLPLPSSGMAIPIAVASVAALATVKRPMRFGTAIACILLVGHLENQSQRPALFTGRSFFGVYRVSQSGDWHVLTNGRILHGEQVMKPPYDGEPLTYYHRLGPLKEVLGSRPRPIGAQVAAVGLGIGTVALWSKPQERWTFFEIDPIVERIARDERLFTCLAQAKGDVSVVLGDARLRMSESDQKFDVILVDAFSSDAIPVHLMTLEALDLYRRHLTPSGILAVHTSNKFLQLEPVLAAMSRIMGWTAYTCDESRDPIEGPMSPGRAEASWVVLGPPTLDWSVFTARPRWKPVREKEGIEAWTDAHSSLLSVIRKSAFSLQ